MLPFTTLVDHETPMTQISELMDLNPVLLKLLLQRLYQVFLDIIIQRPQEGFSVFPIPGSLPPVSSAGSSRTR